MFQQEAIIKKGSVDKPMSAILERAMVLVSEVQEKVFDSSSLVQDLSSILLCKVSISSLYSVRNFCPMLSLNQQEILSVLISSFQQNVSNHRIMFMSVVWTRSRHLIFRVYFYGLTMINSGSFKFLNVTYTMVSKSYVHQHF